MPNQRIDRRPRVVASVNAARTKCCATDAGSRISALRSWLVENEALVNDALDFSQVGSAACRNAAVRASAPRVLKGTELLSIPEHAIITVNAAKNALNKVPAASTLLSELSDECILAVYLLLEKAKGNRSTYWPLITSLPALSECSQPFLWTEQEQKSLKGSPVLEKARQIRIGIEDEWKMLNKSLFMLDRDSFPEKFTDLEDYLWAQTMVLSQCVSVGTTLPLAMVPLANSCGAPNDPEMVNTSLQYRPGMFFQKPRVVLVARLDILPGEQLGLSLGDNLFNEDYLLDYGFVLPGRSNCRLEMEFSVASLDRFLDDKADILETQGLATRRLFSLTPPTREGKWEPPEDLDTFLRLVCLSGPDAFLLEAVFRGEVWEHMSLPVSKENEKAVCDLVIAACDDALEEYGEPHEEEECAAHRLAMARAVVEAERSILESCKAHYSRQIASLDALEYYAERRLDALDLLRPLDEDEIVDAESGLRNARAFDQNY